jgi:hypothetical protein
MLIFYILLLVIRNIVDLKILIALNPTLTSTCSFSVYSFGLFRYIIISLVNKMVLFHLFKSFQILFTRSGNNQYYYLLTYLR